MARIFNFETRIEGRTRPGHGVHIKIEKPRVDVVRVSVITLAAVCLLLSVTVIHLASTVEELGGTVLELSEENARLGLGYTHLEARYRVEAEEHARLRCQIGIVAAASRMGWAQAVRFLRSLPPGQCGGEERGEWSLD